jgi:site-specific DNA recombinase
LSGPVRAAIYARYSSDRQSPCSITDQNRKCVQFAAAREWTVLDDCTFADAATSGTISDRAGLQKLLAAAERKPRPFDVILVDDTSRLSRKISDALQFSDRLKFAGVRLVFVSQGFDSDSEQSDILMAVHGITDSQYIKDLSKKTFRGLEGRVLQNLHHGGNVFGYRSAPIVDKTRRDQYGRPLITGARLQVDPEEAKIIRKLFRLYADGLSIKGVTKQLNREKVQSPRPRPGREHSWAPSSVKNILENRRYVGVVTYGRTKKIRNPQTGKRIYRPRPESEWIKVASPEQRIVSDELFQRVQDRLRFVNETYGDRAGRRGGLLNSRVASSRYIFSGLLKCGTCGGSITITSGAGTTHRSASYGCPARDFRGTCSNDRHIPSAVLETQLLAKLQHDVLSPAAIDYVFEQLETKLSQHLARVEGNLEDMRRRKAKLEEELRNLTSFVASGGTDSPTLRQGITEREAEISALTAKTLGRGKNSVHGQIRDLRKRVTADLGDLRALLSTRDNAPAMRMVLARHVKEIVMLPGPEAGEIKYKGEWNLLGDDCAEGSVPRARIGLATPAFSGPRSTGELPRHRCVE